MIFLVNFASFSRLPKARKRGATKNRLYGDFSTPKCVLHGHISTISKSRFTRPRFSRFEISSTRRNFDTKYALHGHISCPSKSGPDRPRFRRPKNRLLGDFSTKFHLLGEILTTKFALHGQISSLLEIWVYTTQISRIEIEVYTTSISITKLPLHEAIS